MYRPRLFDCPDRDVMFDIVRANGFALVVTASPHGMVGSHIPLHLTETADGPVLQGHVARGNGHWRLFDGRAEAMAVFQGRHAYVSPRWYATADLVPTWNYEAVHAYGRPRLVEDTDAVVAILAALTDSYEAGAERPWRVDDLPAEHVAGLIRGIVAFEIPVERLEGKRKMSQNRKPEDVQGAIAGLKATGRAADAATAAVMAEILDQRERD